MTLMVGEGDGSKGDEQHAPPTVDGTSPRLLLTLPGADASRELSTSRMTSELSVNSLREASTSSRRNLSTPGNKPTRPLRIALLHPDLGIGGAERLVVDAATELVTQGHHVDIFTAYHNPKRALPETTAGCFSVQVRGNWFPRDFLGRLVALCAYIRCALVALSMLSHQRKEGCRYDVVLTDQVPIFNLVIKWFSDLPVLYYCHYPDLLLTGRESVLKRMYRAPIDYVEEVSTGKADRILVNSKFTAGVFCRTFRRLYARGVRPGVLYPGVDPDLGSFSDAWSGSDDDEPEQAGTPDRPSPAQGRGRGRGDPGLAGLDDWVRGAFDHRRVLLSVNRYERKKRVELAIEGLAELLEREPALRRDVRMVVAGGYDERLRENREYFQELTELAASLGLSGYVGFVRSCTEDQKWAMVRNCTAVVYTPPDEHFGIVPLEAMVAGKPVVACNSGGPRETVREGRRATGVLCDPTPGSFCAGMAAVLAPGEAQRMGANAWQHARDKFSRAKFGERLLRHICDILT